MREGGDMEGGDRSTYSKEGLAWTARMRGKQGEKARGNGFREVEEGGGGSEVEKEEEEEEGEGEEEEEGEEEGEEEEEREEEGGKAEAVTVHMIDEYCEYFEWQDTVTKQVRPG